MKMTTLGSEARRYAKTAAAKRCLAQFDQLQDAAHTLRDRGASRAYVDQFVSDGRRAIYTELARGLEEEHARVTDALKAKEAKWHESRERDFGRAQFRRQEAGRRIAAMSESRRAELAQSYLSGASLDFETLQELQIQANVAGGLSHTTENGVRDFTIDFEVLDAAVRRRHGDAPWLQDEEAKALLVLQSECEPVEGGGFRFHDDKGKLAAVDLTFLEEAAEEEARDE